MINEAILRENIYQHVIKIGSSRDIFDLFKILGYPVKQKKSQNNLL